MRSKVPVFSSAKLTDMDIALGPEMKSTGEVLGIDKELDKALYKGFLGAGMNIPTEGNIFVTLKDSEQNQYTADILSDYIDAGFKMYVTDDTMDFFKAHDLPARGDGLRYGTEVDHESQHRQRRKAGYGHQSADCGKP